MVARTVAERSPVHLRQPAEHIEVVTERLERLHRRTELEVRAGRFRRPHERTWALIAGSDDTVRRVDVAEADWRLRLERRERRRHRVEQRQRNGRAHAAQERAPGQGVVQVDHGAGALLIWNGALFTTANI